MVPRLNLDALFPWFYFFIIRWFPAWCPTSLVPFPYHQKNITLRWFPAWCLTSLVPPLLRSSLASPTPNILQRVRSSSGDTSVSKVLKIEIWAHWQIWMCCTSASPPQGEVHWEPEDCGGRCYGCRRQHLGEKEPRLHRIQKIPLWLPRGSWYQRLRLYWSVVSSSSAITQIASEAGPLFPIV